MYKGRINRKAFILYTLGLIGMLCFSLLTLILCVVIFNSPTASYFKVFFAFVTLIMSILYLLSISGSITTTVRRLHDVNLSGWWFLLYTLIGLPFALIIELANKEVIQISTSVNYLIKFCYLLPILIFLFVLYFIKRL